MCEQCLAATGKACPDSLNYKNFNDDAIWPLTSISHDGYVATASRISAWNVLPGWTLQTCSFDWMHNLYLGLARDYVASSIQCMITQGAWPDLGMVCNDHVLGQVHSEILFDCKSNGNLATELRPYFVDGCFSFK